MISRYIEVAAVVLIFIYDLLDQHLQLSHPPRRGRHEIWGLGRRILQLILHFFLDLDQLADPLLLSLDQSLIPSNFAFCFLVIELKSLFVLDTYFLQIENGRLVLQILLLY